MITVQMTRDKYNETAARLKAEQGIVITGDEGDADKDDVDIHYAFDGEKLQLMVRHKPMLLSVGYCENKMRAWLGIS